MSAPPATRGAPRRLPLLGHLPGFLADRLGFLDRCAAVGRPVVELRLGERTFLPLEWRDVRHVLVQNAAAYDKSWRLASARGRRVSGSGVLTQVGAEHLARRRLLQPSFHPRNVAPHLGGVLASTREVLAGWRDGDTRPLRADMTKIARRAVQRLLFGPRFVEDDDLAWAIEARRRYFAFWFFSLFPRPELLPVRANREHREALRILDEAITRGLGAAPSGPSEQGHAEVLRVARRADGTTLAEELLRDELRTLLVTGHETVGECLTWTWLLLHGRPAAAAALRREVHETIGAAPMDAADTARLPYTDMVIAESLRLRPPTWLFVRIAQRPDRLPSGALIPAGTKVYLCPWLLHRSPRSFADPERFDPERFRDRSEGGAAPPGWFPFGAGPRVCLGESFARPELGLVLATIARDWRVEPLPGQDLTPSPGITLHPREEPRALVRRAGATP